MATKRTDAFDVFASKENRRDADVRALKSMSPHSTLRGMGNPIAPVNTGARGTVPPPVSIQDAEVLVSAATQITPNPLFDEDLIELVEESGLLILEPEASSDDDAIEVSSSFLIEDLDGFPAGVETAAIADLSHHAQSLDGFPAGVETAAVADLSHLTEDIEEMTSDHLAYVETRGEIVEVERPRLAPTVGPNQDIAVLNRQSIYNDSAEYSDGVPRLASRARGLSSKTLRVPAPRSPKPRAWLRTAAIGAVFLAGIGAGVGFAVHSATPTAKQETAPAAPAAVAALAAPAAAPAEPAAPPAPVEETLPVVAPLDEGEAQDALAAQESANPGPQVQPLDVESLDSEASAPEAEPAVAEQPAKSTATEPEAELEIEPTVVELPPTPEATKTRSKERQRSKRATKPDERQRESAVINAGAAATASDPGVLMLAAKPPCQIKIDGKTTGLTTPQRVLKLSPGKHRVTLTNREHRIRDSFKVSIVSGQKTRIVRDNTSKIK